MESDALLFDLAAALDLDGGHRAFSRAGGGGADELAEAREEAEECSIKPPTRSLEVALAETRSSQNPAPAGRTGP